MQLPLEVCQQFGQFAFQDEQKGVAAIAIIQSFLDEDQDDSISSPELRAKTITINRNQAGAVTVTKSVKLLPNIQVNLKALVHDTLGRLQETVNFSTIVIGGPITSDSWLINIGAALYLLQFSLGLKTVNLKAEHGGVLVALYHLSGGELNLEIPLVELQAKMEHNYHFSLSAEKLDDVLEDLIDLHCVSRQEDVICLTEKVVLKDN